MLVNCLTKSQQLTKKSIVTKMCKFQCIFHFFVSYSLFLDIGVLTLYDDLPSKQMISIFPHFDMNFIWIMTTCSSSYESTNVHSSSQMPMNKLTWLGQKVNLTWLILLTKSPFPWMSPIPLSFSKFIKIYHKLAWIKKL